MTHALSKYYPLAVDRHHKETTGDHADVMYRLVFGEQRLPQLASLAKMPVIVEALVASAVITQSKISADDEAAMRDAIGATMDVTKSSELWESPGAVNSLTAHLFSNASVGNLWHHYRWINSGRRIYDLSPELVETFANMEMNFPVSALKIPYPEFFIAADTGETVFNEMTGEHRFGGVYVSDVQHIPIKTDPRRVELDFACPDGRTRTGVAYASETCPDQHIEISVCGWPHEGSDIDDDAIFRMNIPLTPGLTIEESLKRDYDWRAESFNKQSATKKNAERLIRRWCRVAINMMIYLASIEPDVDVRWAMSDKLNDKLKTIENKKQRQRFIKKHCKETRVIYVGHERFKSTRTSPVGHIRRGHARWQACGPKWSKHKLIWIDPKWIRGRDGEIPAHITEVSKTGS